MVVNLLCKYGVVPKQVFPETASSSSSGRIDWLLTVKLREYALELRALVASTNSRLAALSEHDRARAVVNAARTRKDAQMKEVYRIMAIALGTPPKPDTEFTWEYVNTKGEFRRLTTTSRKFLKSVKTFNPKEACSLVNDPRRAYDKVSKHVARQSELPLTLLRPPPPRSSLQLIACRTYGAESRYSTSTLRLSR